MVSRLVEELWTLKIHNNPLGRFLYLQLSDKAILAFKNNEMKDADFIKQVLTKISNLNCDSSDLINAMVIHLDPGEREFVATITERDMPETEGIDPEELDLEDIAFRGFLQTVTTSLRTGHCTTQKNSNLKDNTSL